MAQDTSRRIQGMAVLGGAVLLGSTFLSFPVAAQTVDELKAQIEELTNKVNRIETQRLATPVIAPAQAVTAGSFPGSITLPGTSTSFRVSGYIKADFNYTTRQGVGESFGGNFVPLDAPGDGDGITRFHAKQSRFRIVTSTPTDFGTVKTHMEADFEGGFAGSENLSNSAKYRLRHAYGTLGNLLLGQTWTNYMWLGQLADTSDFNGPMGVLFIRQPQIRYTMPFGDGLTASVSVENPQSLVNFGPGQAALAAVGAGSNQAAGYNEDKIPDFTAKLNYAGDWGWVGIAGLLGATDVNFGVVTTAGTNGVASFVDDTEIFWSVSVAGRIKTWGKDSISPSFTYSEGYARGFIGVFTANPGTFINVTTSPTPDLQNLDEWGFTANYEHWWTDNLYSVAAYGIAKRDNPAAFLLQSAGPVLDQTQSLHVNLHWVPVPKVNLTMEYMMAINDFEITPALGPLVDDDNSVQRIQFSAQFTF